MTNEVAIHNLFALKLRSKLLSDKEAIALAIKALEQQPCEDAISRQAVKEQMIKYGFKAPDMTVTEFVEDCLPSVTPQPKTGHWINLEETKYKGQVLPFWCRYECSECGGHGEETFNYCPNCGARMEV